MVLILFTLIIMLSSHTIGTLQCEEPSRTTPLAGKVTAIHTLKEDHHDLLDKPHHEESVVGEEEEEVKEEEVKEEREEKEGEKVTEEIETEDRDNGNGE